MGVCGPAFAQVPSLGDGGSSLAGKDRTLALRASALHSAGHVLVLALKWFQARQRTRVSQAMRAVAADPETPEKKTEPKPEKNPSQLRALQPHKSEPDQEVERDTSASESQRFLELSLEAAPAEAAKEDSDGEDKATGCRCLERENLSRRNLAQMKRTDTVIKTSLNRAAGLGLLAVRQLKAGFELPCKGPWFPTYQEAVDFCIVNNKTHFTDPHLSAYAVAFRRGSQAMVGSDWHHRVHQPLRGESWFGLVCGIFSSCCGLVFFVRVLGSVLGSPHAPRGSPRPQTASWLATLAMVWEPTLWQSR